MTGWLRLTFRLDEIPEDDLVVCLHEAGTLGVQSEHGRVLAWFPRETDVAGLEGRLAGELQVTAGSLLLESVDEVEDGFWQERWVESLRPIEVGQRFLIVPGPATPPDSLGRIVLRLTPGRAFGTGEHCTTRMCLEMMEDALIPDLGVLDLGTGSGILAIAAARLGARRVVAIDNDAEAVVTARTNARINETPWIHFVAGGLEAIRPEPFGLVLANLTGTTLERLMRPLSGLTVGDAVLSGILREERDGIELVAGRHGLRVTKESGDGEWVALRLAKVGHG